MELSSFNIVLSSSIIFSQKKVFLIFWEIELSYNLGNGNPEKIPYISGNETFLYFRRLLIFQEVNFRARKVKRIHH